ncbi:DUF1450 domain-containing protein [Alicyclobacillus dauci]|uniref:YuzB family protein n=1 Tax=Alicyclobacillus dauci TaxID=1475485 RepID=A0ABY6Z6G7_9BACL|nr:DUF1450 domain-containing protein [Alicyclobacillus dauci]WAH37625.1 YuzB family protein [Alicyclobacillus dauci]
MGMGIVIVEVCDSSLMSGFNLEELESLYPGVSVLRSECLSKCGLCHVSPYAYVNGHIVFDRDPDTCYEKIKQRIEYEFALMDEFE